MQTEKEDLSLAIQKLKNGIGELNREGRERLQKSFQTVALSRKDAPITCLSETKRTFALQNKALA